MFIVREHLYRSVLLDFQLPISSSFFFLSESVVFLKSLLLPGWADAIVLLNVIVKQNIVAHVSVVEIWDWTSFLKRLSVVSLVPQPGDSLPYLVNYGLIRIFSDFFVFSKFIRTSLLSIYIRINRPIIEYKYIYSKMREYFFKPCCCFCELDVTKIERCIVQL